MRGVGAGRGRTTITVPMATIRDATMAGVITVGIAGKQLHLRMTEKGGPAWAAFYMSTSSANNSTLLRTENLIE